MVDGMKSIEKNSLYNVTCTVLDMFVPFLMSVYAARILLADGVGRVAYAQNITSYFAAFAEFGLTTYGIREIARVKEKHSCMNKIFTELLLINSITTTCALLFYAVFIFLTGNVKTDTGLFLVCGLSIVFNYFNIDWFYQGEEEYGYIAARNLAVKMLSLALIFLLVRTDKDFIKYALIMSLTGGFNFIINVTRTHKCVKLVKEDLSVRPHIKKLLIFASGTLLIAVYRGTGVTMLGILSTKTEAGCYSYAFTMIKVLAGICTAVAAVFFPRLSYYYKVNQIKFYEFLRLALKVMVFFSFPACTGIFLIAPPIVTVLLGEAFLPTAGIMRILSLLIIIWGFSNVAGYQLLLVTDNERVNIPAYFIVTVITVILDCILIPVMSGSGAALVFVSGELIVNSYLLYRLRRFLPSVISWKALGQALFSTTVMGIAVHGIMKVPDTPVIQCIVGVAAGIFIYGTVNLILKNEILLTILEKIGRLWALQKKGG